MKKGTLEVGSWCKKPNSEKIKADRSERENVKVEGITKCIRYRHKCLTSKGCQHIFADKDPSWHKTTLLQKVFSFKVNCIGKIKEE